MVQKAPGLPASGHRLRPRKACTSAEQHVQARPVAAAELQGGTLNLEAVSLTGSVLGGFAPFRNGRSIGHGIGRAAVGVSLGGVGGNREIDPQVGITRMSPRFDIDAGLGQLRRCELRDNNFTL